MEPMDIDQDFSGSWRVRDAAQKLVERGFLPSDTVMPSMSSSFDVDTCLARLRRDKAAVVRGAFEAAAQAVLYAVKKKGTEDAGSETLEGMYLPPLVEQWQQLQDKKANSMALAQENKEKKKARPSETTSAVATGAAKGSKTTADSKKPSSKSSAPALMPTSAATSDSRLTVSKAVLCTSASVAFDLLTPPFEGHDLDVVDVPQNVPTNTSAEGKQPPTVNMGAVLLQAQTLGQRVASLVENSTRRSRQRYEYRRDSARYAKSPRSVLQVSNPFALKKSSNVVDDKLDMTQDIMQFPVPPKGVGVTEHWTSVCLPRFKAVLDEGSGHAVYCDVEWPTRHARVANLLEELADTTLGPHLIITTKPEMDAFAQEFDIVDSHMPLIPTKSTRNGLRVLTYTGSKSRRRKLREQFSSATGSSDSSFHVMVTSYSDFLEDYLHLCQLPYQVVMLDDGWSWLAAAHIDSNSAIGTLWEQGLFNNSDQHIGLGKEWDFSIDDLSRDQVKRACIGLTARHRILTSPSVYAGSRDSRHQGPVPGLVKFLLPNFLDNVREEWDRSRIDQDAPSMEHMRKLAARSIIVYHPTGQQNDLYQSALDGMKGFLPPADRSQIPLVPTVISDDTFIEDGKVSQSRRSALLCFGHESKSWIRYELGSASLLAIQDAMRSSGASGYVCEEVVTASSLTSSGATGTVSGSMAYRLAVRCGRSFGSELGLRQHVAAMHAPPGTWLCRTCGVDCGTSPSRTAHERTCGQPPPGTPGNEPGNNTAGSGPIGVVGKKLSTKKSVSGVGAVGPEDKDSDGSFRVPGYRGVWVNPSGKHFVKVSGERLMSDAGGDDVWFFDAIDDAARKHDEVARERGVHKTEGLNFEQDGSRIAYEESTAAAAAGRGLEMMGGGASSVVPALSVINIKDLPKDVTPLLRDPRQTSRTGGNSKRHVYAYRGVCRQTRKGHDRWQSQISFSGTNHYLGTFDSEWDAAAIYAWAHLILYGEEATRKARLEGEEAAAAYEQEKKDIAAGKVVVPPPKPPKKKRKKNEKKADEGKDSQDLGEAESEGPAPDMKKTKKRASKESPDKKVRTSQSADVVAELGPLLSKGVVKVPFLEPRRTFEGTSDSDLMRIAAVYLQGARDRRGDEPDQPLPISENLRPCAPMASVIAKTPVGCAMLAGLSPLLFGWNVDTFLSSQYFDSAQYEDKTSAALNDEYGVNRSNDLFRTVLQGTMCVIGRASERMERAWERLGLGSFPLGGTAGELDCNIGGLIGSCSDAAATIAFCPSGGGNFQFCANNDSDMITLNGHRILASSGSFPLFNEDVCTVGARVFVFLLPTAA